MTECSFWGVYELFYCRFAQDLSYQSHFSMQGFQSKHYFLQTIRIKKMLTQNKRNSQFILVKEEFIDHILGQIEQHYELNKQCLGQGGFGQVFQGRRKKNFFPTNSKDALGESFSSLQTSSRCCSEQPYTSQRRAIKRITYKQSSDKQLMRNEMQILSYLDHPLIVKLYQTFQHNKNLYLVIDLLKGGDLFTVISQREKLSENQARAIFVQLVKALKYLHAQHICHRDLKLENIMFLNKEDFNIKLVDFGLAFCWDDDMKKELRQNGLHNKMIGTPDYMSPQMLVKNYDQRCDIWSAGVILYMLLSGKAPFYGPTEKDIIQSIKNLEYTFDIPELGSISDSAKDLIQKIFKPENQRISLKQILQHPWILEDDSREYSQAEICSTKSIPSERKLRKKRSELRLKNKTTKETQKILRKGSLTFSQDPDTDISCKSYCSQEVTHESCAQQLTVAKLQHYSRLSKLQKFQAIFSVSKLSQTRTKTYGEEFLIIDKDNDGTISLQDLIEYLNEIEGYNENDHIQSYFNQVALSKRGYIGYSEYLACVLAYHGDYFIAHGEVLEFDERFSEHGKNSIFSEDDTISEHIDLFDDCMLEELFALLDRNSDGQISKKDFIYLLEYNGIDDQNADFLKLLTERLTEITYSELKVKQEKQSNGPWFIDPRTFKDQLSRTYKGESDGGISIDFRGFRHLMRGSQACQN